MIESVKAAWALVGHKLKNHSSLYFDTIIERSTMYVSAFLGRCPVEEKYYVATIGDDTPMEYLVPTTSEAGVCTTALVDFLTLIHNNFIERCRGLAKENDQRYVLAISCWLHQSLVFNPSVATL